MSGMIVMRPRLLVTLAAVRSAFARALSQLDLSQNGYVQMATEDADDFCLLAARLHNTGKLPSPI